MALARGIASLPARRSAPALDPIAEAMLHPALGALLRGLSPAARRTSAISWSLRLASLGLVDHVALRTAAIDEVLGEACVGGAPQVILLGAGLDARAWRLPALRDATVFEVDHPATQRFKRSRVDALAARAKEVRFVSVDFEHQPLGARLAEEGHDATRPSFWIWEGVVPYLEAEASRATLHAVRARSAPGSALAVTYGVAEDGLWLTRFRHAIHIGFRVLGEPLRGLTTTAAFHRMLRETGWSVGEDTGPLDWCARYGYGVKALLSIEERLVLARIG